MNNEIEQLIRNYVLEFFDSDPRKLIERHEEKVVLNEICYITRKSIKYITHSRQRDEYSVETISNMIISTGDVIESPAFTVPNHNSAYPNSKISAVEYSEGVLLVVYMSQDNQIFNAFYRDKEKFAKFMKRHK